MPPLRYERLAWASGHLLIGIDEVGRGPLAGPVVAAAVCFPQDHRGIRGVRDSKQVPDRVERNKLAHRIRKEALAFGLGAASVREIARDNIRRATALAMRRALARCRAGLAADVAVSIVIDGLRLPELNEDHEALVQGDAICHAIAAASLVAKVARDRLMIALAVRRPGYGWHTNVGYATREHVDALRVRGLTPHHRILFCDTALGQRDLFQEAED
ncbi:MAG TPA: ribonuclease HII [Gemmatimonadales bacterium]|jgi:ribonuclease HII